VNAGLLLCGACGCVPTCACVTVPMCMCGAVSNQIRMQIIVMIIILQPFVSVRLHMPVNVNDIVSIQDVPEKKASTVI